MKRWYERVIIWLVALWIGSGALVKVHAAIFFVAPELLGISNRLLVLWVGVAEMLLVIALLCAVWQWWVRRVLCAVLLVFTCVHGATIVGLLGHCGCLGALAIPSWAMVLINGALCVLLYTVRHALPIAQARARCLRYGATIGITLCVGIGVWVSIDEPVFSVVIDADVTLEGTNTGDVPMSILDDPVQELIQQMSDTHTGRWRIILWRTDCSVCQEEMPRLLHAAQHNSLETYRWRFVNVGEDAESVNDVGEEKEVKVEKVQQNVWITHQHIASEDIITPTILDINNGQITDISDDVIDHAW